jgi:hypothetical protein
MTSARGFVGGTGPATVPGMAGAAPQARLSSARIRNAPAWLVLAAASLALGGCGAIFSDAGRTDTVWVRNSTAVTLQFTIIDIDGKPFDLHTEVAPGETVALLSGGQLASDEGLMVDRCTVGDVIAYDPTGGEVARHPPPLCARAQDVWTIGPPGSPQPSG